jgi:hypothetical protein
LIRNGDEHLGHIKRIYGISGDKSWHGRTVPEESSRVARQT